MSGRMDLEARLQALRARKRSVSTAPSSAPTSFPSPPSTEPVAWPSVPTSPFRARPDSRRVAVAVAATTDGRPSAAPRCSSVSASSMPPVTIIRRSSSEDSAPFPVVQQPPEPSEPPKEPEEVVHLTAAQLLGPAYEEAVRMAQYAIESERRQTTHTAIDAYIRAGQMLIEIGRRQAAPHLQEIVKTKALALLQRAEGLSEWTNRVLANDASEHAVAAAYQQSAQSRNKSLTEKRELVTKMQEDNVNLKERLNQLVLLTKIRGRFQRVISDRRARKAAEAEARAKTDAQAAAQATREVMRGAWNDVTGEPEGEEETQEDGNDVTGLDGEEEIRNDDGHRRRQPLIQVSGGSPREEQKVGLINELHNRIGLPQIDHLRKFEPLTEDPAGDSKQEELQSELDAAKQEAEKLRAAVQEMEECLRLAAQHSKQHSIKLEQQKQQEFAQVQDELERVREELENERRRSASFMGSTGSRRSSVSSAPDAEEFEDSGMLQQLRLSIHKTFHGRESRDATAVGVASGGRSPVRRTSYAHGSPRHTQKPATHHENVNEEEDDGGVWL